MRPNTVLIVTLLALLPDFSIQQYYRDDRYYYPPRYDPNYYDNYYRYTHNEPINDYYGFRYGSYPYGQRDDYGRGGYDGRSVSDGGGYNRGYYDYNYNRGYNNPPYGYRDYYDDYNIRGRSYYPPTGYYYDQRGYYYGRPPYDDYNNRRYPLTPGWGYYDYYYGRSMRDYRPPAKNVDPFPGKFLGFGSVHFVQGGRDVELHCNLSKDGTKLVSNVVWVKVENAYRSSPYGPPFGTNPYYCPAGGCIYKDIDFSNRRFFADMHGDIATLHIYDLAPGDYGVYRCSATAQATNGSPSDTEATYQIVEFFN